MENNYSYQPVKLDIDGKIANAVRYIDVRLELPRSPRWVKEACLNLMRSAIDAMDRDNNRCFEFYEDSVIIYFLSLGL